MNICLVSCSLPENITLALFLENRNPSNNSYRNNDAGIQYYAYECEMNINKNHHLENSKSEI